MAYARQPEKNKPKRQPEKRKLPEKNAQPEKNENINNILRTEKFVSNRRN